MLVCMSIKQNTGNVPNVGQSSWIGTGLEKTYLNIKDYQFLLLIKLSKKIVGIGFL